MNQGPLALLLIHGFGGGARDYRPLERFLKERDHAVEFFEFLYDKKLGQVSIDTLAEELATFVRGHIGVRTFFVVGFSQGGLIFRRFVFNHPEIKGQVAGAVTVCTPHHGSLVAYLAVGKGVADLRPNSALLRELSNFDDGIPYHAVYNPYDELVVPGANARYERAVINKKVSAPLHFLTFGHTETLHFVEKVLFS